MSNVANVALLLSVLGCFVLIGSKLLELMWPESNLMVGFSLCTGLAIWTVISSFAYQFGVSPTRSGSFLYAVASVLLVAKAVSQFPRFQSGTFLFNKVFASRILIFLSTVLFLTIPGIIGGINFSVFLGNHWDHLSYLGLTQSVSLHSFSEILNGSNSGLPLNDPVTALAVSQIQMRPSVEILVASLVNPLKISLLDSSYFVLLAFKISLLYALTGFIRCFSGHLKSVKQVLFTELMSALFIIGFWGQYLLDIDAWSALSCSALIVFTFVLIDKWVENPSLNASIVLIIVTTSMFLLYPEGVVLIGVPFAVFGSLKIYGQREKSKEYLVKIALIGFVEVMILNLSAFKPIAFMLQQLRFANGDASKPWAGYFQAYLLNSNGSFDNPSFWLIKSIPMGISGMYFVTIGRDNSSWLGFVFDYAISSIPWVATVLCLRVWLYSRRNSAVLASIASVLIVIVYLIFNSTVWSAAKALNLIVPLLFAFGVVVAIDNRAKIRETIAIRGLLIVCLGFWAITQLVFGMSRIMSVSERNYAHDFPYVSIQDVELKSNQDWTFTPEMLAGCSAIEIDVTDPFQNFYLGMKLNELNFEWFDSNSINSYFGVGTDLGNMNPSHTQPDCVLLNSSDNPRRFIVKRK